MSSEAPVLPPKYVLFWHLLMLLLPCFVQSIVGFVGLLTLRLRTTATAHLTQHDQLFCVPSGSL